MAEMNTVTIPLEDYIELRRKADETIYLSNQLGRIDSELAEHDRRIFDIEGKLGSHG